MVIDILKNIIKISSNKKKTLLYFFDDNIVNKVNKYNLLENYEELYLNDYLYCIRKDNLQLEYYMRISYIDEELIGLQKNNNYTIYINPNDYYIFIKTINRKNNKLYFEELLKKFN